VTSAPMTGDDWKQLAFGKHRTAKLATVRANGAPHVAPVWVALDGDQIVFTTGEATAKGKALRRDPRVAMSFDDEVPPFSFVVVEGQASISEDAEALLEWSTRIGGRYMGEERAEEFGRRNAVPGELLVRVHPTRIVGHWNLSE
jgi:PPOX class probable F420-dependent enzyme